MDTRLTYRNVLLFYKLNKDSSLIKKLIKKKKKILLKISSKGIKYLVINFTKELKNIYKNYKTLIMKATEDDTKGWKDIHALGLECLLVTSKMAIPPKAI